MKSKITVFFIIGLLIYLIDIGFNSDQNTKDIFISDQEITSLISAWKSQVGRNPTDDEISRIISNLVEEEILYREALLLGLDREDRIIKRRLAQKITFLKQKTTNFGWSLEVAILRRGALQIGLPQARLEKRQKNNFLYKEFANLGWSLQLAVLCRGVLQIIICFHYFSI